MTVYSSSSREFRVGEIIRLAYVDARMASMHATLDTAQLQYGRDKLDLILDRLPASAPTVRQSRLDDVVMAPGVGAYALGEDVIGVPGPVYWTSVTDDADAPDMRRKLDMVGMVQWNGLAQGDAVGDPSAAWPELGVAPPVLHVWPVPLLGGTLRLRVTRLLADAGPGANTFDLDRVWVPYLQRALAAELCRQRSMADAAAMAREADAMLEELNRVDGEGSVCNVRWVRHNRWRHL